MKEHRDPKTVAEATMNQLANWLVHVEINEDWALKPSSTWPFSPFWKAVNKASRGDAGRVANDRRKSRHESQGPDDQPSST